MSTTTIMIFIILLIGIVIGLSGKLNEKWLKHNDRLTLIGVLTLLFLMGIKIGNDKEVIQDLKQVGFSSFVFGISTILGSILIVFLFSKLFFKGEQK